MTGACLENIAIVLCRPQYPENIGAAARAMCNMGIRRLVVVAPRDYDHQRILRMATRGAQDVARAAAVHTDLDEALAPFQYVVGATARRGAHRQAVSSPRRLAAELVSVSHHNRVALLFGPESSGLTNADIRYCHRLVNIPTDRFASLNLAQAVMIVCYELFMAQSCSPSTFMPRLATRHELDGMYAQLKDVLVRISYINPQNPDYWLDRVRQFLSRVGLRAREVSIIRGVCRQIDWYGRKCFEDGLAAAGKKHAPPAAETRPEPAAPAAGGRNS